MGHVAGTDGRRPFKCEGEEAVLEQLRLKWVWPYFAGTQITIGAQGYRGYGFHEKQHMAYILKMTATEPFALSTPCKEAGEPARKRFRISTNHVPLETKDARVDGADVDIFELFVAGLSLPPTRRIWKESWSTLTGAEERL